MKKIVTGVALSAALVFGTAGSCEKPESNPYYEVEFPDCDADDKVGKWDTADCGPSPLPMKTAYQKAPTPRKTGR